MKVNRIFSMSAMIIFSLFFGSSFAQDVSINNIASLIEVEQYNRAIHIMAMLLLGFGFLMVFVRKYGRSALTASFLLVSVSLPLYFLISDSGLLSHTQGEIKKLILAEFGAASLLIAAGAVLGRLKMHQYIVLGLLFIPFYMINEWIILDNGLGIIKSGFADTGGSIVIHTFGALFGVAAAYTMTTKNELETPVEVDANSDRYSMLGSMVLWVFWPSFCAALVPLQAIPATVINVFLALCGSTIITYILSVKIRGKINIADIANAALAGGVAIGATCDFANHWSAFIIGIIAGAISTIGFAVIKDRQQRILKTVDTCGVTNLHGLPGIFGGLAAIPVISGLNIGNQLLGIAITITLAVVTGLFTGKVVSLFGRRKEVYVDSEEFEDAEY
ncbi:MAG: ammonium transporter [Ignavibacteria bacterium]